MTLPPPFDSETSRQLAGTGAVPASSPHEKMSTSGAPVALVPILKAPAGVSPSAFLPGVRAISARSEEALPHHEVLRLRFPGAQIRTRAKACPEYPSFPPRMQYHIPGRGIARPQPSGNATPPGKIL